MLLGDVIARFDDESFATETLFSLDDLALTARVLNLAAERHTSPGSFAMQAVNAFVRDAEDEEWLALIELVSRADDPGQAFLRRVLSSALPRPSVAVRPEEPHGKFGLSC